MSYGINENLEFVEDITHLFLGPDQNEDDEETQKLITRMENKSKRDMKASDIHEVIGKLKEKISKNKALEAQVKTKTQDLAQMQRLNKELTTLIYEMIRYNDEVPHEVTDRIKNVMTQFKKDSMEKFVTFRLGTEIVDLTVNQLKYIVSWYDKGHVYLVYYL